MDAIPAAAGPHSGNRIFLASLLLNSIVLYPILHADRFYVDDLGRAMSGYTGWTGDGRPLTTLVMQTLNIGTPLTDISPLPQLLAMLLLACCAVLVARKFGIRDTASATLAAFPLCASPFFLENLSYKFDALTMVSAVTLAVLAVTATPVRGWRAAWGAVCLLGTLCLYQAALNVFLVFAVLEFLLLQLREAAPRELARQAVLRILQVVLALVPYQLIAAVCLRNTYSRYHASLIGLDQLPVLGENARGYWSLISDALAGVWAWPITAAVGTGVVLVLLTGIFYLGRGWHHSGTGGRIGRALLALLMPLAWVLSALGPLLLLEKGVFVPRAMVGVGALIAASLILISLVWQSAGAHRAGLRLVLSIPAYSMLLLAVVYGNAMRVQNDYENRLSANLADDFAALNHRYATAGQQLDYYVLTGSASHPPLLDLAIEKYPYLARLMPVYLSAGWGWATDLLHEYNVQQTLDTLPGGLGGAVSRKCEHAPALVRASYRLYVVDRTIVVSFNNAWACPG